MTHQFISTFERMYCKKDEPSFETILEKSYYNAFELADNLAVILRHYFETGEGMTASEAVTASNTVAQLLQSGNESLAAYMTMQANNDLTRAKKTHTLERCVNMVHAYSDRKIEAIKKVREITGANIKDAKDFVEAVIQGLDPQPPSKT